MATNSIPVSFDFFKKYTYHEEWVDFMLKLKSNGNQQTYETLLKSTESHERALQSYYEAFYLKPQIREKYHIRIKPVPKKIKDKLLSIPVQDIYTNKTDGVKTVIKSHVPDASVDVKVSKNEGNKELKRILPTKQYASEEDLIIDDDEPVSSQEVHSIVENNEIKAVKDKEGQDKTIIEKVMNEESPIISCNDVQQSNIDVSANVFPSSSKSKKPNFNYKDLVPYIHCCPLTFKEFRTYSNINKLVKEFCEKQRLSGTQKRMILHRSYILFYLAPEHRNVTPINKVQLIENCPSNIKDKFFSIPKELYTLNNPQESQKVACNNETELVKKTNDINQEIIIAPVGGTITNTQSSVPLDCIKRHGEASTTITNKCSEGDNKVNQQKTISPCKTTNSETIIANNETQQVVNSADATQAITRITSSGKETSYVFPQKLSKADPHMVLPISLHEFKKYTYYEEIVEKLFKIKSQDNKDLFLKYKNCPKAFENTLQNYYRAFYMLPAIREIWPIRFKAIPNFLKNRLLQIPAGAYTTSLINFKIESLVSLDLNVSANNKEIPDAEVVKIENVNKSTSPIHSKKSGLENEIKRSAPDNDSNSSLGGIKRASCEGVETLSPKRQKMQEIKEHPSNTGKPKASYKELLPYAHYCPISFSEFCKYTNISELFRGYCEKRYNSIAKLPCMLKRAYILFYLAPEHRKLKPFNKLAAQDNCPSNLKDKIFEIPKNFYLNERQNGLQCLATVTQGQVQKEGLHQQTGCTNDQQIDQRLTRNTKDPIEILENRLLPPTQLPNVDRSNKKSQCSNINCVFYHISYFDFMKLTNVLSFVPEPHDVIVIENMFKKFIYELVIHKKCDTKYVVNCDLLCKLLQHNKLCEKCENDVQTGCTLNNSAVVSNDESKTSNVLNETVIAKSNANISRRQSTTKITIMEDDARQNPSSDTNSIASQREIFVNDSQTQQQINPNQPTQIWVALRKDKIFSKFCQKLLSKLNESLSDTVDFDCETFNIFLQCNEIPLRQILNDFCDNNEDIVQRILNQLELYKALQRFYYYKYLTNKNFALKYPAILKQTALDDINSNSQSSTARSDEQNKTLQGTERINSNSLNGEKATTNTTTIHEENASNTMSKETSLNNNNNNALEKAKRIFFRNADKTHTLAYVLRTSFDYKQVILRAVLELKFDEFLELTNVYEGKELYADNHVAECMYNYVFRSPLVWPTNLYITLENLCKYLLGKNIAFDNYSTMLTYISPKLLHWSVLLSCTNLLDCVQIDYESRTGKTLDTYDIKSLKQECIEYYNRCWKYEKWLGATPLVNEEFYKDILNENNEGNGTRLGKSVTTVGAVSASNDEYNKALEAEVDDEVEICTDTNDDEFNYVLLPNTQKQIEMLPREENASKDPLNNSNNVLNLTTSESSCEIVSLGELTQPIKTEPTEIKLLSNLRFYEDESSKMQCSTCEDEVVDLDSTIVSQVLEENLPPLEMNFEEVAPENILPDVLPNSDSTSSGLINLAQQITSVGQLNSNDETSSTQQFIQPSQSFQLPDVSLASSGETESLENNQGKHLQKSNVGDLAQVANEHLEYDFEKQLATLLGENSEYLPTHGAAQQTSVSDQQELADKKALETAQVIETVLAPLGQQQQIPINNDEQVQPCTSKTITSSESTGKSTHQPLIRKTRLPMRQAIKKKNTTNKTSRNVATVKPLKNADIVPQIPHNTRPLLTMPAYSARNSNENQAIEPGSEILLCLAPTSNSQNSSTPSSQNSGFQLQLSNLGTHIFISQEMNSNCSIFDNSSLLRIVDHDYNGPTITNLPSPIPHTESIPIPRNSVMREEQQYMPLIGNTSDTGQIANEQYNHKRKEKSVPHSSTHPTMSSDCHQPKKATSRTSVLGNNTNDKVNNTVLTHYNNIVASITLTIRQPQYHPPLNMARRLCLHRNLIKFHYFKELTPKHVSEYLLPSSEIGKSYTEALVTCENFKTRISNRSISVLFPFWPQNLQRDFLLVLNDLKEFHYVAYDPVSMKKRDDLRERILFWLLNTAPSFSFCYFIYDVNNSEFSHCESIKNGNNPSYNRKPFKCLTNALSPKILHKLRVIKGNLHPK